MTWPDLTWPYLTWPDATTYVQVVNYFDPRPPALVDLEQWIVAIGLKLVNLKRRKHWRKPIEHQSSYSFIIFQVFQFVWSLNLPPRWNESALGAWTCKGIWNWTPVGPAAVGLGCGARTEPEELKHLKDFWRVWRALKCLLIWYIRCIVTCSPIKFHSFCLLSVTLWQSKLQTCIPSVLRFPYPSDRCMHGATAAWDS